MSNRFEQRKEATRQQIQEAFIQLIHEKDYDDITVREISERAGIGFKTYYRHYEDKVSLIQAIVNILWSSIAEQLQPPLTLETSVSNVGLILNYVKENAQLVRAITRTPLIDTMLNPIYATGTVDAVRFQVAALGEESDYDEKIRDMIAVHFVKSQLALITWWLENDCIVPIKEMEAMIQHLIMEPIWNLPKNE